MNPLQLALLALQNRDKIESIIKAVQKELPTVIDLFHQLFPEAAKPAPAYDVKWLQAGLNKLGAKLVVDGDLGPATHDAIKAFQQAHGLDVDGWAGTLTTAAIDAALRKV